MGQKSSLITELEHFRDLVEKTHRTTSNELYTSIYDFVLKEAKMYTSQKLTENEQRTINQAIGELPFAPQQKQCFKNSQSLVFSDDSDQIKYVEGYIRLKDISLPIHISHAWNEINGKVIDITLAIKDSNNQISHNFGLFKKIDYFGVVFSNEQILERQQETGEYTSLIEMNRNLLSKKHST